MNIEEKIDICAMKLNGYTLQEIGDKYGVSRERIRQILQGICNPKPRRCHADWLYPNIAKWANESRISNNRLGELLGVTNTAVRNYMIGKRDLPKRVIDKLIEISGMTYEKLFEKPKEV